MSKMKVVQVNAYCGRGSTGKICLSISNILTKQGIKNIIYYTQGKSELVNSINYNPGKYYTLFQSLKSKLLGNNGFNSHIETYSLINKIKKFAPDIVHLHNLHAQNINLDIFSYFIEKSKIDVIFTFHDCWMLTGYCHSFDMKQCNGWKQGCGNCHHKYLYSWIFDRSGRICSKKKEAIERMNPFIVTPSKWLAEIVGQSQIKSRKITVINNGIDLSVFRNKNQNGEDEKKDKFIVLGVAERWDDRKGLDVFIHLAKKLGKEYQIMLVGTDVNVEKKLPENIIAVRRTESQLDLADIYSRADVFVNPTREEVFGLVNIEALACGTPVVTFKTGGSPECIDDRTGFIVEKNNLEELMSRIETVCKKRVFNSEDCRKRAEQFDENILYLKYFDLYNEIFLLRNAMKHTD